MRIICAKTDAGFRLSGQPSMRRNTSTAANAMRLLPSTNGWLMVRLSIGAAASAMMSR
jgi:hypothetical protein